MKIPDPPIGVAPIADPRNSKKSLDRIGHAKRYFYNWVFHRNTLKMNAQLLEKTVKAIELLLATHDRLHHIKELKKFRTIKSRIIFFEIEWRKSIDDEWQKEFIPFLNPYDNANSFERLLSHYYKSDAVLLKMRMVAYSKANSRRFRSEIPRCTRTHLMLHHALGIDGKQFASHYDYYIYATEKENITPRQNNV